MYKVVCRVIENQGVGRFLLCQIPPRPQRILLPVSRQSRVFVKLEFQLHSHLRQVFYLFLLLFGRKNEECPNRKRNRSSKLPLKKNVDASGRGAGRGARGRGWDGARVPGTGPGAAAGSEPLCARPGRPRPATVVCFRAGGPAWGAPGKGSTCFRPTGGGETAPPGRRGALREEGRTSPEPRGRGLENTPAPPPHHASPLPGSPGTVWEFHVPSLQVGPLCRVNLRYKCPFL